MALINCPECKREVSDKALTCPCCGYPIRNTPYLHEIINGKDIDLEFIRDESISQIQKIQKLKELSGCDLFKAKEIVLKYSPTIVTNKPEDTKPKCPHCHSTNISPIGTGERMGSVMMLGLFSKKINKSFKCKNCKYTW